MTDLLPLPHQASVDMADNKRKAEEKIDASSVDGTPVKKSKLDTESKEHPLGEAVTKTQVALA